MATKKDSPVTDIVSAVAELRAFIAALKRRPDVTVTVAQVGRKASQRELAALRLQPNFPAALIDLYAEMNGVHVEWHFIEPPGGGCLRIPPLTQWTRFTGDDEHYMNFGQDHEALLLDEIQPEGGTWLVRNKKSGQVQLVFASAAEGADGISPADSIVDYLKAATRHGFVHYWPRCFQGSVQVSYADQETALERFRAAPVKPSPIRIGVRIQSEFFSEGLRGEVLAVHEAPDNHLTQFCGRRLVQVKFDEGTVGWLPVKWLKALKKTDAYERLRDPRCDFSASAQNDLPALHADLARAIGQLAHHATINVGMYPSNARRAAGLLSTRPLSAAITMIVDLYETTCAAKIELGKNHHLEPSEEDFSAKQFARHRGYYSLDSLFTGLFGGLFLLACHESARRQLPGNQLVPASLKARLQTSAAAASLRAVLEQESRLEAPLWRSGDTTEAVRELGLPAGAVPMVGTGF